MNISEEKACLCAACQRRLINYNKAIEQVTKLSSEIISKINVPSSASQAESSHSRPNTGGKRSAVAALVENNEVLTSPNTEVSHVFRCACVYSILKHE